MVKGGNWLKSLLGRKKDERASPKEESLSRDGKANEYKKPPKEKRRWTFGRSKDRSIDAGTGRAPAHHGNMEVVDFEQQQNMHAMAVAAATAAAAEAAVAAAQAAAAVVRLTSNGRSLFNAGSGRDEWAAIKIQTAFRGYLARRALRALRGLVKLQALVRGHIVRKQAAITLRCMQALVRVQARVRARRVRLSDEGLAVQRQLSQRSQQQTRPRRSTERWNASPDTVQETETKVQQKQAGAMKRERALAYAFSQQLQKDSPKQNSMVIDCEPDKTHWGWSWLDRWMGARPWESPFFDDLMNGTDSESRNLEDGAKIVEMDTGKPGTVTKRRAGSLSESVSFEPSLSSTPLAVNHTPASQSAQFPAPGEATDHGQLSVQAGRLSISSPVSDGVAVETLSQHGLNGNYLGGEEESILSTAQSSPRFNSTVGVKESAITSNDDFSEDILRSYSAFPNYMATTQSSKAKLRSHSAPKQRPDPSERNVLISKKRLSLHDCKTHGIPARMQRSSSQVRVSSKGFAGPFRLDKSTISLKDSETSSVNGDFRRP